eukprot:g4071.t1
MTVVGAKKTTMMFGLAIVMMIMTMLSLAIVLVAADENQHSFSIVETIRMNFDSKEVMQQNLRAAFEMSKKIVKGAAVAGVLTVFALSASPTGLSAEYPLKFRIMAQLRTPLMVFIVVPLSFARWLYTRISLFLKYQFCRRDKIGSEKSWASHKKRVDSIVRQVLEWNKEGRGRKMRTARPNWAAMSTKLDSNKGKSFLVQIGHLNRILALDLDGNGKVGSAHEHPTITVEPGVTHGMITDLLLPLGYALAVQVEMENITVGGNAMGLGMETNSHTQGLFQETVTRYEIVTARGDVLDVTEENDRDLFHTLPWSHGSIGFLTAVTCRIVPIKKYVHVRYEVTNSKEELGVLMKYYAELKGDKAPRFLEATAYSKDRAVIQLAEMVDRPADSESRRAFDAKTNPINRFYKPFYFKHVGKMIDMRTVDPSGDRKQLAALKRRAKAGKGMKGVEVYDEIIPLKHYYHRFTRSIFWEIEDMIPFANHMLYRVLWGWMGAPEVALLKLFQGPVIRRASVYAHVVQESIMPVRRVSEGIENFDRWFGVYPLLLFPIRVYKRTPSGLLNPKPDDLVPGENYGLYVDIGAYGAPRETKEGRMWDAKGNVRAGEHWTRSVGGFSAPYTDIMCTRREFRAMYDHTLYDKVRRRLGADDGFPEVYDKVKPEAGIVDLSAEEALEGAELGGATKNGHRRSPAPSSRKKNGSSTPKRRNSRKRSKTPKSRRRR